MCERHSEPLQRAIDLLLAEIKSGNLDEDVIREEFLDSLAKSAVASSLIWNCLTAKHPAYQHEQEVRLIILGTHWVLRPFIKTRIRGSNIVPYIAHEMLVRAPHSISNIVVGPTAPPDAERTVRTLLESLDIDSALPVSRSDVPYRAV